MSNPAEEVLKDIVGMIKADKLVLPTLPEVALKAREAAEDPNISALALSRVITNDAAITARIIKIANSPLMRTTKQVEDLHVAVSRMGITFTCNLITSLAMEQMFQAKSKVIDTMMRDVWNRSTEVAGIAHVLCRHYTKLRPDQATLAGITHEIGVLPILIYAEEHPELLESPKMLERIIEKVHPYIGDMILKSWDFPKELIVIPKNYLKFDRNPDAPADYIDLITVAVLQSFEGSDHRLGEIDQSTVSAFSKLGIDTSEDGEEEDLEEEMKLAMALLNGDG